MKFVREWFAPVGLTVVFCLVTAVVFLASIDQLPSLAAQTTPPPTSTYVGPAAGLVWNQVTTDVKGAPEAPTGYTIAVLPRDQDMNAGGVALERLATREAGWQGTSAAALLKGLPDGQYRFQVRATDAAGNDSAWGDPLLGTVDTTPPSKPGGLRASITINLTVPVR